MAARVEYWTLSARTLAVNVDSDDIVRVFYPLLAELLAETGFVKEEGD